MPVNAPVLSRAETRELALEDAVFAADVKPHLVHEVVRAEQAARRAGTRAVKTRGLVSGGRSKPWRQKGTGRARAGSTRAPQWTGGGAAFEPRTNFEVKVNRKVRRAAMRSALSAHASGGTLAVLDGSSFDEPSTRGAAELLAELESARPTVVVATEDEEAVIRSFRNLERVAVTVPAELEVGEIVWAKSLVITEAALPLVQQRAGGGGGTASDDARTAAE
jgi:large subunit ribosomal protein L4